MEVRKQTCREMLDENAQRLARVCGELIRDIKNGVPEGKLEITLGFLENQLRQRRQIKAHAHYREACDSDLSGVSSKQD